MKKPSTITEVRIKLGKENEIEYQRHNKSLMNFGIIFWQTQQAEEKKLRQQDKNKIWWYMATKIREICVRNIIPSKKRSNITNT